MNKVSIKLKNLGIMIIGVFLYVLAMNMFISPANLYTGGVTGIAQLIIAFASSAFGIQLSLGGLIFLFECATFIFSVAFNWKTICCLKYFNSCVAIHHFRISSHGKIL